MEPVPSGMEPYGAGSAEDSCYHNSLIQLKKQSETDDQGEVL